MKWCLQTVRDEFTCNRLADIARDTTDICFFLLESCWKRVLGKGGHFDLNIGSILLGAVVTSRADAHQQTALSRNRLKVLPGASRCVALGVWAVMPMSYSMSPGSL